ncbi:MAG: hypothetical protein ABI330_17720, partial [Caldimonas sp.]
MKSVLLKAPRSIWRFAWRVVSSLLMAIGVLVVLAVVGYFGFESIFEAIDSRYPARIDALLGTDRTSISRLHDPTYFAEQSVVMSEDLKTVACISSPEHRILIAE